MEASAKQVLVVGSINIDLFAKLNGGLADFAGASIDVSPIKGMTLPAASFVEVAGVSQQLLEAGLAKEDAAGLVQQMGGPFVQKTGGKGANAAAAAGQTASCELCAAPRLSPTINSARAGGRAGGRVPLPYDPHETHAPTSSPLATHGPPTRPMHARSIGNLGRASGESNAALLADLARFGEVQTDRCSTLDGPTGTAFILQYADNDNAIILLGGANLCWPTAEALLVGDDGASLREAVSASSVVMLQREVPAHVNACAARLAAALGKPVFMDVGGTDAPLDKALLPYLSVIAPNE